MANSIETRGLCVAYGGHTVLRNVSCRIRENEFAVLTGPSGCGKSTLVGALSSCLPPNAKVQGEIHIGRPPVAMIWQEPSRSLSPMRTVARQVGDVLEARGAARDGAASLLDRVGLRDRTGAYPHQLSQGQLQRVSIARALAMEPGVLLADEPTGSLDAETERDVLALIARLQRESGFAVLWMTHRPDLVSEHATSFWQLRDGGISAADRPVADPPATQLQGPNDGRVLVRARIDSHGYKAGMPVLRDIDLVLQAGVTTAVQGPSGAGKSTFARLIAGIEEPASGGVERFAPVSMVWPDPNTALNPGWRVDDAIAEPLQVRGVAKTERRNEARSWMERVRVPVEAAARRVTELSGGQRRRLLIARAMIGGAQAVVFDEATNGLDPALRDEIISLLRELQQERKLAYLWITHDESTLKGFAHESLRLEGGSLRYV